MENIAQIALIEHQPVFRAGLRIALDGQPDLAVVAEAASTREAIELARSIQLDVAVVDLLVPTSIAISFTPELLEIQPRCKILGIVEDRSLIPLMLRGGAAGCAVKTQSSAEILDAIRHVHAGHSYVPPGTSRVELAAFARDPMRPLALLTRREREVFDLLVRGVSNADISTTLFIGQRTVETHRQHIMKKLAIRSMVDLMRLAARCGLL